MVTDGLQLLPVDDCDAVVLRWKLRQDALAQVLRLLEVATGKRDGGSSACRVAGKDRKRPAGIDVEHLLGGFGIGAVPCQEVGHLNRDGLSQARGAPLPPCVGQLDEARRLLDVTAIERPDVRQEVAAQRLLV